MACAAVGSVHAQQAVPPGVAASSVAPAAAPALVSEKVTFAGDFYFDSGSSVIKPGPGKVKLDDLFDKSVSVNLEVIIAVGHTDNMESRTPELLSTSRADAVKGYLSGKGISRNRIYTEGKGASQPVASNASETGRAKNRRVELELVGTRVRK